MTIENLLFVPLRNRPEFLEETAIFLNSYWSKTLDGRLHYLAEGQDDLPCSLILLLKDDKAQTRVIGHTRLNKVLGKPKASFLTCVLIEKAHRGCGLGKKLMQLTETYASQLGLTTIYLSTFDKYEFYKHLGYHDCTQVTPIKASSTLFTNSQLKLLGEQVGEGNTLTVNQGKDDFAHFSPENSVSKNQEAMFNKLNQFEREQGQETDNNQVASERETSSCLSSMVEHSEAVTLTPLQQTIVSLPASPPPPPPPPPPP
ncbi:N-acetyltransferase 6-like, partial [Stylophora pistillata]|uniref:N-acetyltransferase 6-like n=1 Tax=Stylophora pistillata TaxID=50429 RepID=UPI000C052E29